MLYKKYHRNYVSQFKKGVEFNYQYPSKSPYKIFEKDIVDVDGVEIRPFYGGIYVAGRRTGRWILVYPGGKINKKAIHVIQEIS